MRPLCNLVETFLFHMAIPDTCSHVTIWILYWNWPWFTSGSRNSYLNSYLRSRSWNLNFNLYIDFPTQLTRFNRKFSSSICYHTTHMLFFLTSKVPLFQVHILFESNIECQYSSYSVWIFTQIMGEVISNHWWASRCRWSLIK